MLMRVILALLVSTADAALALPLAPPPTIGAAQESTEQFTSRLDRLGDKVDVVEMDLANGAPTPEVLATRDAEVATLLHEAKALSEQLELRVGALRSRIARLEATHGKGATDPPAELGTLRKSYDDTDRLLRRAKLLRIKMQQDFEYIGRRRRAL